MTSISVSTCAVTNSTSARITFSTTGSWSAIDGSISNFINADSVRNISNIELSLYTSANVLKVSTSSASLANFQATTVTATLASSSAVVGATNANLRVNITSATLLKASGRIIITIPQYYVNAGGTYLIGSTAPLCTATMASVTVTINSCTFSGAALQLTVVYTLSSGIDSTAMLQLTIGSFRNPISTQAMSGFSVLTMDSSSFSIGSVTGLILSGISTPAAFTSNTLNLVNSNVIQAYTSISFVLSLSVPLEQNCFLKFIMPSDFTMDDKFTSITGSGFFRPSASSSVVNWITRDTATRTVTI